MSDQLDKLSAVGSVEQSVLKHSQLLAIMFVDASGSSRTTRNNEAAALRSLGHEMGTIQRLIKEHRGKLCSFRGDGLLAGFHSAGNAVRCSLAIQKRKITKPLPIKFRVGIHIGDTFSLDGQLLGDSVNVAARIEALATPGGVLVSHPVYEALRGSGNLNFVSVGTPYLKNIGDDLELFQVMEQRKIVGKKPYYLRLIGSFEMLGPAGTQIAISQHGKVLLAALALSTDGHCQRQWLRDRMFDEHRGPEGKKQLEKVLLELRTAFGREFDDIFRIKKTTIGMHFNIVSCDVELVKKHGWNEAVSIPNLLEDFNSDNPAFNAWLLHQRSLLRSAICLRDSEAPTATGIITASTQAKNTALKRFAIAILPTRTDASNSSAAFFADLLTDWLLRSLGETDAADIYDYRVVDTHGLSGNKMPVSGSGGPDLMLECRAASIGEMAQITVNVLRTEDRKLIWSRSIIADHTEFLKPAGTSVDVFINFATDSLLSILSSGSHMLDPGTHQAAKSAIGAIHQMLTMTGQGLDHVEADIITAYEIDPKPVYLAWLAYMSTFHLGERYGEMDATFKEQTRDLAHRALASGSHNALVLSLVAHVHSYIFHEFSYADDLISRALQANPFCPITWDTASLLYSYTARPEAALKAAQNARRLGQHSPYRHLFDGACCVAAFMNGRLQEAVGYGESVMAVQPEFKAVLRYLAASYGRLGDTAQARKAMRKLIQLEPDLCIERLRDGGYPVPSKSSARLIESGLIRIGLPKHN